MSLSLPDARVTAVIINYRTYAELRACLAALRRDASPRVSCVVVDYDGERDAAVAIESTFPAVGLIHIPDNEGFAAGVNRGARECRSPYLLLLNPDTVPEPGLCGTLADWLDANPSVGAVGPRIRNADGSIQASARRFPDFTTAVAGRSSWLTRMMPRNPLSRRNLMMPDSGSTTPLVVDWVSGACMMVRRTAFDAVGGMDAGFFLYWEDADFCRRLHQAGWLTMYYPGAAAAHAGGRSSRHAVDASLVAFHRSAYRLFRKHASAPLRLLSPLVFVALRVRLAFMRHVVRARARTVAERQPS